MEYRRIYIFTIYEFVALWFSHGVKNINMYFKLMNTSITQQGALVRSIPWLMDFFKYFSPNLETNWESFTSQFSPILLPSWSTYHSFSVLNSCVLMHYHCMPKFSPFSCRLERLCSQALSLYVKILPLFLLSWTAAFSTISIVFLSLKESTLACILFCSKVFFKNLSRY